MKNPWLLLALPLLPFLFLFRLLRRRRSALPGGRGPGGPPGAGVREPRRPLPSPPAAAVGLSEPYERGDR
ncbi:hypothetical protein AB0A77_16440 [Streptomyces varsoviensis]|uniref:hypothetical protein n=2 Tax=Streptomyces varsoviensis TaxID=67373 RepID=UPI0033C4B251